MHIFALRDAWLVRRRGTQTSALRCAGALRRRLLEDWLLFVVALDVGGAGHTRHLVPCGRCRKQAALRFVPEQPSMHGSTACHGMRVMPWHAIVIVCMHAGSFTSTFSSMPQLPFPELDLSLLLKNNTSTGNGQARERLGGWGHWGG